MIVVLQQIKKILITDNTRTVFFYTVTQNIGHMDNVVSSGNVTY